VTGSGGLLGVVRTKRVGSRILKTEILEHGTEVMDFAFNPFNRDALFTVTEDGSLFCWKIPENITENYKNYSWKVSAHSNKAHLVVPHPTIDGLIATSSIERGPGSSLLPTVKIWNFDDKGAKLVHEISVNDVVTSIAFHIAGEYVGISSKNKSISIYSVRTGKLLVEGNSHKGSRGSKLAWVGPTFNLISVGFGEASQREIAIFPIEDFINSSKWGEASVFLPLDCSPSVLIPYYDEDTGVLYCYGRGDTWIRIFEIVNEPTIQIKPCDPYQSKNPTLDAVFLPKFGNDVKNIEVQKMLRLSNECIETISFSVSRIRPEFFQDDIFVDTRNTEVPIMSYHDYSNGKKIDLKDAARISLLPPDMIPCKICVF
jgi:coronin-7